MGEWIAGILSKFETLTDDEKNSVTTGLSSHFGKTVEFSAAGLSAFHDDELKGISHLLDGFILTKGYVPDIRGVYERLNVTDLAQKVSFGRIEGS